MHALSSGVAILRVEALVQFHPFFVVIFVYGSSTRDPKINSAVATGALIVWNDRALIIGGARTVGLRQF